MSGITTVITGIDLYMHACITACRTSGKGIRCTKLVRLCNTYSHTGRPCAGLQKSALQYACSDLQDVCMLTCLRWCTTLQVPLAPDLRTSALAEGQREPAQLPGLLQGCRIENGALSGGDRGTLRPAAANRGRQCSCLIAGPGLLDTTDYMLASIKCTLNMHRTKAKPSAAQAHM